MRKGVSNDGKMGRERKTLLVVRIEGKRKRGEERRK
jgi:hypothetical protein